MSSSPLDRARALALAQDFGAEALELNARLAAANPGDIASRTRLARCYLEAGRLEEAEVEYREVLRLDPRNRIAAGGVEAVERLRHKDDEPVARPRARRRSPSRAGTTLHRDERPVARRQGEAGADDALLSEPVPQVFSGFGPAEFAELLRCPRGHVQACFGPRVIDFVKRVNVLQPCTEMAALREAGKRQLFRLARTDVHPQAGGWFVFNYGGRWEPQVNIAMSAAPTAGASWLRVGIGFNLEERGDGDGGAGREQARGHFERFQRFLTSSRRSLFLGWMVREDGRIQHNHGAPRTDLREPSQAASFIVDASSDRTDWLFFGKWLSPDRAADAATLADPVALVRVIDRALGGLLPLWRMFWE
jgi:hypothetical protein